MLAILLVGFVACTSGEVARLRARSSFSGRIAVKQAPWQDIPVEKAEDKPQKCGPKCQYDCEQANCPATHECEPLCEPPECVTTCSSSRTQCETRCGEPLCAVVCPQTECEGSDCSRAVACQTVCNPPVCTTSCADSCQTSCATPKCKWRCKPTPACPQPACKISCTDLDCAANMVHGNATARAQLEASLSKQGKEVVSEGRAPLDPSVLTAPAAAPAAAPAGPEALQDPRIDLSWLRDALKAPVSTL
ncbi:znfx-1 [Symbiodinium microadriaticum]|nr:znfx-1 [Symbiodinium microadriaticum]